MQSRCNVCAMIVCLHTWVTKLVLMLEEIKTTIY